MLGNHFPGPVPGKDRTLRIVWLPGENRDGMPVPHQRFRQRVDPEGFRPEILADYQESQGTSSPAFPRAAGRLRILKISNPQMKYERMPG